MDGLMQRHPLTVTDLLTRVEENFAHKRVITATPDGEITAAWRDICDNGRRIAAALDALDAPPGARIATLAWNTQRHVELYLGVPASGRVLHTLNHRLHPDELRFIGQDAGDDILFLDRSLLDRARPVLDGVPALRHVVVMDDGGDNPIPADPRILDYDELLRGCTPSPLDGLAAEEDAASLCYTSGTTGRPKGVLYSHRSIALHALMLLGVDNFAISERDVVMPIVPMFHVNAWGLPYAAMLAGSDLVLPGPAMGSPELLRQIERHQVSFSAGVPTIWRGIAPLLGSADVSSLRMVVCGGGATPISLSEEWERAAGIPLTNAWGMTETSPVVCLSRIDTTREHLDEDGRRQLLATPGPNLPFTRMRIVDDAGVPVARDGAAAGELQVAGPTIARAYFAGASAEAFTDDGWLRTGDVASIDPLGYLRIVDRTKDLVKSGGEWISSVQLENEIMAHPDVLEAAVIAIPDERWGERPLAFVVAAPSGALELEDIRAFLGGRVAAWWIPEHVVFVDEIPKTSTGKFAKVALRQLARATDQKGTHT